MEAIPSLDILHYLESIFLLVCGILSLLMIAGFALQEAGFARAHHAAASCFKILMIFALGGLAYYIVGYELMYVNVINGFWGNVKLGYQPINPDILPNMVAAGMIGAILSGVLAERIKIIPLLVFTVILCGLLYPLQGAWIWSGWLKQQLNYHDFAGSTLHMIGGWCALMGALILGPRLGKFSADGHARAFPGSNIPIAVLGTLLICAGWMGFMASKSLPLSDISSLIFLQTTLLNAVLAAFAGCAGSALFAKLRYAKPDITLVLNGTLAGLIAISAGADQAMPLQAMLIGSLGGALCAMSVSLFDRFKIDDITGGLSVHLIAPLWGVFATGILITGDIAAQLTGIAVIALFSSASSAILWLILKRTLGLRLRENAELAGSDRAEIGIKAYPDFGSNTLDNNN